MSTHSDSSAAVGTAHNGHKKSTVPLMIGALGVVFGDIGTSPLYTVQTIFAGDHTLPLDPVNIFGGLSLVFWSLMLVVTIKYVGFVMRADNRGEGGSLALVALVGRALSAHPKAAAIIGLFGVSASALFYGDSMITPAISVISAVEGLKVPLPSLAPYVVPLTVVLLVGLFLIQRFGTDVVGKLFGPVMVVWFLAIAVLGVKGIALHPSVIHAVNPYYAAMFMVHNGFIGVLVLGAVVLAVTGGEALYADMGHFGRFPISLAWYIIALPALVLNYFGQGAELLAFPQNIDNPFFRLAPDNLQLAMVVLATMATIIASQAVISGAYSLSQQAIHLGYLPRMTIIHTSNSEMGQIYVPAVNWFLMIAVVALVIGFGSSAAMASAYGVAVTGNMFITSLMLAIVMYYQWKWKIRTIIVTAGLFGVVDLVFFLANAVKIPDGGWFPLTVAVILFVVLTTWKRGRAMLNQAHGRGGLEIETFLPTLSSRVARVPGTAIFLTGSTNGVPLALLHNLKHNKVIHERVVLLNVAVADIPIVSPEHRVEAVEVLPNVHRVKLHFGFMESPNVPRTLARAKESELGFFYEPLSVSYFLSRETIIPDERADLPMWRQYIFSWMSKTAVDAMHFFLLPVNRVVELGGQVELGRANPEPSEPG